MTLSQRTLFSGMGDISPNDLGYAEVRNFSTAVDARLRDHFRWKGKAIATVGLSLAADNDKVLGGGLVTRGTTGFKEQRIRCNYIWEDCAEELYLAINVPTLDIFR
jgi:hypothetical protein